MFILKGYINTQCHPNFFVTDKTEQPKRAHGSKVLFFFFNPGKGLLMSLVQKMPKKGKAYSCNWYIGVQSTLML